MALQQQDRAHPAEADEQVAPVLEVDADEHVVAKIPAVRDAAANGQRASAGRRRRSHPRRARRSSAPSARPSARRCWKRPMPSSMRPIVCQTPRSARYDVWNSQAVGSAVGLLRGASRHGRRRLRAPGLARDESESVDAWASTSGAIQASRGAQQRRDGEKGDPGDDQARGGKLAVRKHERAAERERHEHVAVPEEIRVQQADQQQGRHPPVVRDGQPAARRLRGGPPAWRCRRRRASRRSR